MSLLVQMPPADHPARQGKRSVAMLFMSNLLWVSFAGALNYTSWTMDPNSVGGDEQLVTATALRFDGQRDEQGFPSAKFWERASAVRFDQDWKGQNHNPNRSTEVRLLWTAETLFLRFAAKYESLNFYDDARDDGWRDQLWDRDVAEVFLQPDGSDPFKYKEFEVAPNGFWIDLDISHGAKEELRSRMKSRVRLNEAETRWTAELAIPMKVLTPAFDPKNDWRVNFFRVEGSLEPRFYSAWSPTYTEVPNFHVPGAFGRLVFRD